MNQDNQSISRIEKLITGVLEEEAKKIASTYSDIPTATSEDVDIAVKAGRRALKRNGGKDWSTATGAYRAK
ncbi:hypothetical protein L2E82_40778 [Cichorium intybus]|uniref:Uncharacterized protein n=1 Tax=Cichorium intybus TaxID=13427 RepID=A0ACB9AMP1_CICIN|nr:hypothetical protein L2E82_40778 [Cichorium intybus]